MSPPEAKALNVRLKQLREKGVRIIDPRQTYLGPEVDLARIHPTACLHPGTRILGKRTLLGENTAIGTEGPTTLEDVLVGATVAIASGCIRDSVILERVQVGANAHIRPGTLLEEEVSTGHSVGLKQTLLLSFVTLGSLINFCDVLMAGGTSRQDHSEVGSGFVHFNFTPWGQRGDKATPSLIGDVVNGVLLRSKRIFLGGAGGAVGPFSVGYGSVAGAGQVLRRDVASGELVLEPPVPTRGLFRGHPSESHLSRIWTRNIEYIGQVYALRAWYEQVRLVRALTKKDRVGDSEVLGEAIRLIDFCIRERLSHLQTFLSENGKTLLISPVAPVIQCLVDVVRLGPGADHVTWVCSLGELEYGQLKGWLRQIVDSAKSRLSLM